MPPRNHCRFHSRPPVVSLGWLGKVIISLKLRLKAVGISPMAGGPLRFDIGRRGGVFFRPPEAARKGNRLGLAQLLFRPRFPGGMGELPPPRTPINSQFFRLFHCDSRPAFLNAAR